MTPLESIARDLRQLSEQVKKSPCDPWEDRDFADRINREWNFKIGLAGKHLWEASPILRGYFEERVAELPDLLYRPPSQGALECEGFFKAARWLVLKAHPEVSREPMRIRSTSDDLAHKIYQDSRVCRWLGWLIWPRSALEHYVASVHRICDAIIADIEAVERVMRIPNLTDAKWRETCLAHVAAPNRTCSDLQLSFMDHEFLFGPICDACMETAKKREIKQGQWLAQGAALELAADISTEIWQRTLLDDGATRVPKFRSWLSRHLPGAKETAIKLKARAEAEAAKTALRMGINGAHSPDEWRGLFPKAGDPLSGSTPPATTPLVPIPPLHPPIEKLINLTHAAELLQVDAGTVRNRLKKRGVMPRKSTQRSNADAATLSDIVKAFDLPKDAEGVERLMRRYSSDSES